MFRIRCSMRLLDNNFHNLIISAVATWLPLLTQAAVFRLLRVLVHVIRFEMWQERVQRHEYPYFSRKA